MQRIYSSKLYLSSKRQSAIKAAIEDPINVELVKQLRSYLDEDYQDPSYVDTGEPKNSSEVSDEFSADMSTSKRGGASDHSAPPAPRGKLSDAVSRSEAEQEPEGPGPEVPEAENEPGPEPTNESTHVAGSPITASECCSKFDVHSLLGTLNAIADTAGVVRVVQKSDEIWIYYSDNINLNSVMEAVIYQLMLSMYPLEFNRLARTDNAIVFQLVANQAVV